MSNGLDPDSVHPDLGPNVYKGYQLTTKVTASKERVKVDYNLSVTFFNLECLSQMFSYIVIVMQQFFDISKTIPCHNFFIFFFFIYRQTKKVQISVNMHRVS